MLRFDCCILVPNRESLLFFSGFGQSIFYCFFRDRGFGIQSMERLKCDVSYGEVSQGVQEIRGIGSSPRMKIHSGKSVPEKRELPWDHKKKRDYEASGVARKVRLEHDFCKSSIRLHFRLWTKYYFTCLIGMCLVNIT